MRVTLNIRWAIGDAQPQPVEELLFQLLAAMDRHGSLRGAAQEAGVSYRHAWGMLIRWEAALGHPLARLSRGRGASLTQFGRALLDSRARVARQMAGALTRRSAEAAAELTDALPPGPAAPLRIAASHSLGVERLRALASEQLGQEWALHVCGSLESLRRLHTGECELAGFHVPAGRAARRLAHHFLRWLDPDTHILLRVMARRQGLMLAAGNPHGIATLADLTRPEVHFVNRQEDSGTRLLLDDLLAQEGLDARRIDGYRQVEFTHTAVASMVASGAADAGFGIGAAAAMFRLDFVPLAEENYFFALPREALQDPRVEALIGLLRDPSFQRVLAALHGYDPVGAGEQVTVEEALRGMR